MSDVRKVERPTRAKVDPLAEATEKWDSTALPKLLPNYDEIVERVNAHQVMEMEQAEMMAKMTGLNRTSRIRPASNQPEDRDKSPIEAALDSLHSATHLLDGRISELIRRLEPVSLPVMPGVGNERKPASSPMEEAILDRRDEVMEAHDRIRGIIERLQL